MTWDLSPTASVRTEGDAQKCTAQVHYQSTALKGGGMFCAHSYILTSTPCHSMHSCPFDEAHFLEETVLSSLQGQVTNTRLKLLQNFSFLLAYPIKERKFYGDWRPSQGDSFELEKEEEREGKGGEIPLTVLREMAVFKFYRGSCSDQETTSLVPLSKDIKDRGDSFFFFFLTCLNFPRFGVSPS